MSGMSLERMCDSTRCIAFASKVNPSLKRRFFNMYSYVLDSEGKCQFRNPNEFDLKSHLYQPSGARRRTMHQRWGLLHIHFI